VRSMYPSVGDIGDSADEVSLSRETSQESVQRTEWWR